MSEWLASDEVKEEVGGNEEPMVCGLPATVLPLLMLGDAQEACSRAHAMTRMRTQDDAGTQRAQGTV